MEAIRHRNVLEVVLLQTLSEHPSGMTPSAVYDAISEQYEFPDEWYRELPTSQGYDYLKQHGHPNWRDIPQTQLVELVKTEPQWQNMLRWSRNNLKERGLLDPSSRGLWLLTSEGLRAAHSIDLNQLEPAERRIVTQRRSHQRVRERPQAPAPTSAPSLRDTLLAKLETLVSSMPLTDLELLVDIARAVRLRSLDPGAQPPN